MLLFYSADDDQWPALQRRGTPPKAAFFPSLEEARREGPGRVLVVDTEAHAQLRDKIAAGGAPISGEAGLSVGPLPPSAFANLDPYCPPEPVAAGGGYVLQAGRARGEEAPSDSHPGRSAPDRPLGTLQLLLIYRRGVWDLPKGKQDPGEDLWTCALREVREETGLSKVQILGPLGPTVHGYHEDTPAGARYSVKTTHWFLMQTPERALTPEREEGIEKAVWVPWNEAGPRFGYETLRRHHSRAATSAEALLTKHAT